MSAERAVVQRAGFVLVLALFVTLASGLIPGVTDVAHAADTSGAQKVAAFDDVIVGPNEVYDHVVAVFGDVTIDGTVTDVVVVVFGDLTVGPEADIGGGPGRNPGDASIVSVFGDVTVAPGAQIVGDTVDVAGGFGEAADAVIVEPIVWPWRVGSVWDWVWFVIGLVVVAVIAVAIAPRQVAFVRDRVRNHIFSSLGWGALGTIVGIPIVSALLLVTVIGIALLPVWWLVVWLVFLFGFTAVGAALGSLILGRTEERRGPLMAAAALGVVILCALRWIPVANAVILFFVLLVGYGATWVAIWDWRRQKRRRKREEEAARQVAGMPPPGTPPAPPYTPPAFPTSPPGAPPPPPPPPAPPPPPPAGPQAGSTPSPGPSADLVSPPGVAGPEAGSPTDRKTGEGETTPS